MRLLKDDVIPIQTVVFFSVLSFLGDDPDASWFSSKYVQTVLRLCEQYYAKDQMFAFFSIL